MGGKGSLTRKAKITLNISEFELPPMQDLLIVGKKAPIGPEAVKRMAQALSPDQFSVIRIEHPRIEAVLIRSALLQIMDEPTLLRIVTEEAERMISETMVLRSELRISVTVQREVELT